MDMRKLMAFGPSSFIVSIPKGWVESNRLKKGDVLLVDEKLNELVIIPQNSEERRRIREISIDCTGASEALIKTQIIAAYVNNYDIIRAKVNSVSNLRKVKAVLQGLVGMEIIEETGSVIVAKELLDMKEISISALVRRIDNIVRAMLTESQGMPSGDTMYEMDSEVNRLTLVTFRTVRAATENPRLLKLFDMTLWECVVARDMALHLERFADQIKRIARISDTGVLKEPAKRNEFLKLLKEIEMHYRDILKIYYAKDTAAAYVLESKSKTMLKQTDAFLGKHRGIDDVRITEYLKHMIVAENRMLRAVMEK